jgi:hypothetical protein
MDMKRQIVIGLLAAGTVLGYAGGFASMRCNGKWRREAFERRVASVCVEAARGADRESARLEAPRRPQGE